MIERIKKHWGSGSKVKKRDIIDEMFDLGAVMHE